MDLFIDFAPHCRHLIHLFQISRIDVRIPCLHFTGTSSGSKAEYRNGQVDLLLGTFTLMGIVLSNGYKGIVTSSVLKPFDRAGIRSLQVALQRNYKYLTGTDHVNLQNNSDVKLRDYCCQSPARLSVKLPTQV
jgi:hypothetical protein